LARSGANALIARQLDNTCRNLVGGVDDARRY
jgi:hypothetical protein